MLQRDSPPCPCSSLSAPLCSIARLLCCCRLLPLEPFVSVPVFQSGADGTVGCTDSLFMRAVPMWSDGFGSECCDLKEVPDK